MKPTGIWGKEGCETGGSCVTRGLGINSRGEAVKGKIEKMRMKNWRMYGREGMREKGARGEGVHLGGVRLKEDG